MTKKMKMTLAALLCTGMLGGMTMTTNAEAARIAPPEYQAKGGKGVIKAENLNLETKWDKCFPKSDKVDHKKVTFVNRYGITLAADMYTPKKYTGKLPAIAVCGAFGAVKEQHSGLYAQTMAERGFLTIAFDPSFTGESGGNPRYTTSPDINTEDFSAAVDFLSVQDNVDPERIGIIGICGWGGLGINAAAIDTRIKASAIMTMYDMSKVMANGYFDDGKDEATIKRERMENRRKLNAQRTLDYKNGTYELEGGVPDNLPDDAPDFVKQYYDYYKTGRGYHPRSLNSNNGRNLTSQLPFINMPQLSYADEIETPVLLIHGEKAHSRYFSEYAFEKMTGVKPNGKSIVCGNKELVIVPGAIHCDLYDGGGKEAIPFKKIESFFTEYLK